MKTSVMIKECETMRANSVHVVMCHAIVEMRCVNVVVGVHMVVLSIPCFYSSFQFSWNRIWKRLKSLRIQTCSIHDFPYQLFQIQKSHLALTPILKICRTLVQMSDLSSSQWIDNSSVNSFLGILLIPVTNMNIPPVMEISSFFCHVWHSFPSFSQMTNRWDHAFLGKSISSLSDLLQILPLSQWIALFHHAEFMIKSDAVFRSLPTTGLTNLSSFSTFTLPLLTYWNRKYYVRWHPQKKGSSWVAILLWHVLFLSLVELVFSIAAVQTVELK